MSEQHSVIFTLSRMAIAALLILSGASGLMTYQGLKIVMASAATPWLTFVVAGVMSLAITVMIYAFWRTAFDAIGAFRRGAPLGYGMLITLVFIPFIIGVSSWFNVTGIAGIAAQDYHLNQSIARVELAVDARSSSSLVSDQFGACAEVGGRILCSRSPERMFIRPSDRQWWRGARSVSPCAPWRGSCSRSRMCGCRASPKGHWRNPPKRALWCSRCARLRRVGVHRIRKTMEVARLVDQLRGVVASINSNRSLALLRAGVSSLPSETSKRPLSARSEAGRARQQSSLNDLNRELQNFSETIMAEIDALPPEATGAVPALERLNAARAVALYAHHYVPFWIAGIALDLMPLALLLFVFVQRAVMTEEEIMIGKVLQRTTEEVLLEKYADILRRAPGPDTSTVRDAVDFASGRLPRLEDRRLSDASSKTPSEDDDNA